MSISSSSFPLGQQFHFLSGFSLEGTFSDIAEIESIIEGDRNTRIVVIMLRLLAADLLSKNIFYNFENIRMKIGTYNELVCLELKM